MKVVNGIIFFIKSLRFIPLLFVFHMHPQRLLLKEERDFWIRIILPDWKVSLQSHLWLLINLPEYRSVLYFRLGASLSGLLSIFARKQACLYFGNIHRKDVGVGLVIQHGHSTRIGARRIGRECQIWQNVTIGTNRSHSGNFPLIGDKVRIGAGAIVVGDIEVGNNVVIGAGSVVTKSIPDNCVVAGNPAIIISMNGHKCKIPL